MKDSVKLILKDSEDFNWGVIGESELYRKNEKVYVKVLGWRRESRSRDRCRLWEVIVGIGVIVSERIGI